MRVVLVGPAHPHRGGIAQYTSSLFQALELRHEVLLISFRRQYPSLVFPGRTQLDESGSPFRVPCEPLLDSLSPRSWSAAGDRIGEFQPDVLIFQWWQPFFGEAYRTVIQAAKRKSSPCVLFLCHNILSHREGFFPARRGLEMVLARRAFRSVDGFLVQAAGLAGLLLSLRPGVEIRKIHHPLYDFFSQWDFGPADTPGGSPDPTLLFFGNVRRYKGLEVFLQALALVRKQLEVQAVVAGEFYVDPVPFRRLARKLGIDSCLVWQDRYVPNEQVPGLFRAADLVVLPYLEATQSGVVPVAYQFGIPVIASDVGGLSEVVKDGVTGYLVPPGDFETLASKILQFFQEDRADEFRREIRTARTRLSWGQVVNTIEELAETLKGRDGT